MNRVYLSGPMSHRPNHNFHAFNEAERLIRRRGYDVSNPASKGIVDGWEWEDYMRHDIAEIMACDGLVVLPGWELSRGACLEVHIARELRMPIYTIDHILGDA